MSAIHQDNNYVHLPIGTLIIIDIDILEDGEFCNKKVLKTHKFGLVIEDMEVIELIYSETVPASQNMKPLQNGFMFIIKRVSLQYIPLTPDFSKDVYNTFFVNGLSEYISNYFLKTLGYIPIITIKRRSVDNNQNIKFYKLVDNPLVQAIVKGMIGVPSELNIEQSFSNSDQSSSSINSNSSRSSITLGDGEYW